MPGDDDPAKATLRVAESVIALVRAELRLGMAKARASGEGLLVTLAMTAASVFLAGLAVIVVVLAPMLWALSPNAAAGSLGIAVTLAFVSSLMTLYRWRGRSRSRGVATLVDEPSGRDEDAVLR